MERYNLWSTTRIRLRTTPINIYLNDMFLFLPNINITNVLDDTTPYEMDKSVEVLIEKLTVDFNCFQYVVRK